MKPPYEITNKILRLLAAISEKIGEVNANYLDKPSPELRKRNRVKTIKASLEIEGNTLTEEQITAIIDKKRVVGPKQDILEVVNAIEVYSKIKSFKPTTINSFLQAHKMLMQGLVKRPGALRSKGVGIMKGDKIAHVAPPPKQLNSLLKNLFKYLKDDDDLTLIKSAVVHYEIEFIHPFIDGNGRMGRLWQTLILLKEYPVFEFLPFETIIKERQDEYYRVLEKCDKEGKSTKFIEFIFTAIDDSLEELSKIHIKLNTAKDRLEYFLSVYEKDRFTRKDYINTLRQISTSTASRDLKFGIKNKYLVKRGDKRTTEYEIYN